MKKRRFSLFTKIFVVLSLVIAVVCCGYFSLDKIIIPRNFSKYGVCGVKDLTNVFASLYGVPKESKIIENGFDDEDLESAVKKLQSAGYKIEDDGSILQENISSFQDDVNSKMFLTDSEIAAVCNALVQSEILSNNLQNLNYIEAVDIEVLDFVITPDENNLDTKMIGFSKANVKFIVKINTENLCKQISEQMDTAQALLDIIIPENLYFTVDYDIDLSLNVESRIIGKISINDKSYKKSEVLINLLINFIFPKEDEMTVDKFTKAIGELALSGIDALGEFSFIKDKNTNQYGLLFG